MTRLGYREKEVAFVKRIMLLLTLAMALTAMTIDSALAMGATRTLPDEPCAKGPGNTPKASPSPVIFGEDEPGGVPKSCTLITPSPEP